MADRLAGELDRIYQACGAPDDDALAFPTRSREARSTRPPTCAAIARRSKRRRLDETHNLHGLRHTFGTRMAAAGVPMRVLQEWMGHRDISTTERYADYAPSQHESELKLAAGTLLRRPSASHPGPRPCRAERGLDLRQRSAAAGGHTLIRVAHANRAELRA
jgi:integrase